MKINILITGHTGFIGSHMLDLLGDGIGLDIKDGNDIRTCNLPDNITHVFHFAARRSVPGGEAEPQEFISTNCWGTTRLLRKYKDARFINISSSSAELCLGVYGCTKDFTERIGRTHPNCLSVRLYNVFGERQPLESGAIVPTLIDCMMNGKKPVLRGDGSPTRDFTYVGDVVLELKRLMFDTDRTGLAHVGYSDSISVKQLASMIYDREFDYINEPLRDYEIPFSLSPEAMPSAYYGRQDGIDRTLDWWKLK